jgi:hypothetical protein
LNPVWVLAWLLLVVGSLLLVAGYQGDALVLFVFAMLLFFFFWLKNSTKPKRLPSAGA